MTTSHSERRLYVVVRADLPPGLQMAQACHATREFTRQYPAAQVGDNLVVLHVPNEAALQLFDWCVQHVTYTTSFREPDLGDQLTAIAFGAGEARRYTRRLPLAFADSQPLSDLTA